MLTLDDPSRSANTMNQAYVRAMDAVLALPADPANRRKQLKGAPYPAPHHILCAAVEGASPCRG